MSATESHFNSAYVSGPASNGSSQKQTGQRQMKFWIPVAIIIVLLMIIIIALGAALGAAQSKNNKTGNQTSAKPKTTAITPTITTTTPNKYNNTKNCNCNNTKTLPIPILHNFTTKGRTGRLGLIQSLTIQESGNYLMILYGARGGNHKYSTSLTYPGGKGAKVTTVVYLTAGTSLSIVVGQAGGDFHWPAQLHYSAAGGGGGSFVYSGDTLYAAAGGGGGAGNSDSSCPTKHGFPGQDVNDGGNAPEPKLIQGGKNGHGGNSGHAGGGAGWFSEGKYWKRYDTTYGGSRAESWAGGDKADYHHYSGSPGGFGGGGGGICCNGAGGGGGYSGGAGGSHCSGGGGGSYCSPAAPVCHIIKAGNNNMDGMIKLKKL